MNTKKYVLKDVGKPTRKSVDYTQHLNAEQLDVVQNAEGASLVLAGAGSGKTRTLIYRLMELLDRGVAPEEILLVTFTNKAAHEMRNRAEQHLGGHLSGLWCGTFHHVGLRILRTYHKEAGLSQSFGILDEEDSRLLIKASYGVLPFKPTEMRFPQPSVVQRILSMAVNTQTSVDAVIDSKFPYLSHYADPMRQIGEEYRRRKDAAQSLDFDDLLQRWIDLMAGNTDASRQIKARFRYCMVDEYQDINPLQNRVIEMLSETHGNLVVVGDDAQSIYSFRGADIRSILEFPKRHRDTRVFKLEVNYRSTPEVLELANASIQNNQNQFHKELKSIREGAGKPQLVRVRDTRDQASFIAQRILEYIDEGMPLNEIAVLFRARYQAAELELELARRKITYVLRGGVRFFEQAHIKDITAYLKIMQNPRDEIAWTRALTLYPGIGPETSKRIHAEYLERLAAGASPECIGEADFPAKPNARAKTGLDQFKKIMKALLSLNAKGQTPDLLIEKILDSGYIRILESRFENAMDRLDDLKELSNFAHTYKSLEDFLADIALRENFRGESFNGQQPAEEKQEQLVLSTIHQAKGLEWNVVFILSLAEGQFPHHQAVGNDAAIEEERRLFYVATTRCRNELFLIHPMIRYDREAGSILSRVSPFIDELPDHVLETTEVIHSKDDFPDLGHDDGEVISLDEL